jgi:DNA repair protein RadD
MTMRELRPYQQRAIDNLRTAASRGVKRVVLQAPTGAGKTLIASAIVASAMEKGKRVAFVVPAINLIDQTLHSFWKEDIRDVGVIQANHEATDWSRPVQICSVQTLNCRGVFPEVDVVIIDECHVIYGAHKKWLTVGRDEDTALVEIPKPSGDVEPCQMQVVKLRPPPLFVGLSATPWTKGLGKYYDELHVVATTQQMIDGIDGVRYLSPFRCFATGHPDLSRVRIVAGEYHEGDLSGAMQKGALVADIIDTWKKRWGKDKTLCFAVDCVHAKNIQERFQEEGVNAAYQDGTTPRIEREQIKEDFHSGLTPVVVSVGTMIMGVDWDVRCIIYARPTRSEMRFVQAIGRGLRMADGKDHLMILDHSDTTERLGLVTDIHHEELDDGRKRAAATEAKEKEIPLPKPCPECAFLMPAKSRDCPNCGLHIARISEIVEEDGELVEITAGERKKKPKEPASMEKKRAWYAQLLWIAEERHYSPGFAAHKYKSKFGVWPNEFKGTTAQVPSVVVRQWVKHEQIKWAKSRRNPTNIPTAPSFDNGRMAGSSHNFYSRSSYGDRSHI